jgi:DNA-binding Lrp family transcriptional regulator
MYPGGEMSATAYILISCKAGTSKQIKEIISVIDGVETVDAVAGPYDLITIIQTEDYNSLAKIVMDEIQSIDGVEKTITCNVIKV